MYIKEILPDCITKAFHFRIKVIAQQTVHCLFKGQSLYEHVILFNAYEFKIIVKAKFC